MKWITVLGDPADVESVAKPRSMFLVLISSTLTSTIPGISIAGASPELTLYTPALDVEYLVAGLPKSLNVIPATPDGLPTPAVLTRASLELLGLPVLVVDAGSKVEPRIPHAELPSRTVGDIRSGRALPGGTSRALFEEARLPEPRDIGRPSGWPRSQPPCSRQCPWG